MTTPPRHTERNPLVSVVVPSFQQGRFLGVALRSLLNQSYTNLEILVHDNQSTDESEAILEAHRAEIDAVIEADRGQSDALARGFCRAQGSILTWLNADDLLMPDAIATAVDAFESAGRPDVVYGHCAHLTRQGDFDRYFYEIQPFSRTLLRNTADFIAQPGTFFRSDTYRGIGGIREDLHYAMDWELWCRFARSGASFHFSDQVLAGARFYPATKTSSGGWSRAREILYVNKLHKTGWVPWGALAHLYGDVLRPRVGNLASVPRWFFRSIGPGGAIEPSQVLGLREGNVVVGRDFTLAFPVARKIAGFELHVMTASSSTGAAYTATLRQGGGSGVETSQRSSASGKVSWRFETPVAPAALEVVCRLEERAPISGPAYVHSLRLYEIALG